MSITTAQKVRENRARRVAARQGYKLVKSRRRDPRALDFGRFVLISSTATVDDAFADSAGLTLDEVENVLGYGSVPPSLLKPLVRDLIQRTEDATRDLASLVLDSGVTMTARDIAEKVERALPSGYPAPSVGTRLDFIEQIASDVLTGKLYAI